MDAGDSPVERAPPASRTEAKLKLSHDRMTAPTERVALACRLPAWPRARLQACMRLNPSRRRRQKRRRRPRRSTSRSDSFPSLDMNALLAHTKVLSSDEYEGRAPGTKGEELSVSYLTEQFRKAGLQPGNTDGTYVQKVPLVGITPEPAPLVFTKGGQSADAQLERRCRRVDQARGAASRASTTPSWCSSATASSRPSSTGTTTKAWTSRARRW